LFFCMWMVYFFTNLMNDFFFFMFLIKFSRCSMPTDLDYILPLLVYKGVKMWLMPRKLFDFNRTSFSRFHMTFSACIFQTDLNSNSGERCRLLRVSSFASSQLHEKNKTVLEEPFMHAKPADPYLELSLGKTEETCHDNFFSLNSCFGSKKHCLARESINTDYLVCIFNS